VSPRGEAESRAAAGGRRARIIAIANQKGGVGKTTTAVNLATAFAEAGRRVLLIDLDPQGNASTGLGFPTEARGPTTYDLLRGDSELDTAMVPTVVLRLFLMPGSADLAGIELEMSQENRREFLLARMLRGQLSVFDEVLIDCPPSLNLLTINALVAADSVLVPLQCEFYALEGLAQLMRTIERVQQGLNPRLALEGVLLTMYDQRNNLSEQVAADVRRHFGGKVYATMIPRNVRVSEAPSHGLPALLYDPRCAGSLAYTQLAAEMMRQGGGTARAREGAAA
jgi:chromosome partitioning protein